MVGKLSWKLSIILAIVLLAPLNSAAAEEGQDPLAEAAAYFRSNFGLAFKQVLVDISDSDTTETVALLEGDLVVWPYLSFQSPTRFFGESSFGWVMEYGLSGCRFESFVSFEAYPNIMPWSPAPGRNQSEEPPCLP